MLSIEEIRTKARQWLGPEFNEETRKEVREMLEKDEKKLVDAFYQDLEFGTGGLRGIMGAGTNRMNIYTLGMATQGLSNYIIRECGNEGIKVAIAHDCRNNSRYFIEGKDRTYVEGSYFSPALEQPTMIVSTPIKDEDGNTFAVLAGRLNLEELSEIISSQVVESGVHDTYLVNSFNFFVSEPKFGKNYILKKAVHTEGIDAGLSGKDGIGFYNNYLGVPVVGAYKWLPEFKMCIISEVDQSEAFAPVMRLAWIAAGSVIAICIIAVILQTFAADLIFLQQNLLRQSS